MQTVTIVGSGDGSISTSSGQVKSTKLDEAYLRCQYDYSWSSDTTNKEKRQTDLMALEIGKNVTKFYSYKTYQTDSLLSVSSVDEIMANPGKFSSGSSWCLYRNYPSGKETLTDKIATSLFSYEEEQPKLDWTICDSTGTILGYPVQKATCTFRGRSYIAWFAPEIAIPEGPYKFRGLPGLILEIYDTQNHYHYTLTGLSRCEGLPITMKDSQYLKTTRKKYTQTLRRYAEDPVGFITSTSNVRITVKNEDGTENKDYSKSKAMKYDFMERDIK